MLLSPHLHLHTYTHTYTHTHTNREPPHVSFNINGSAPTYLLPSIKRCRDVQGTLTHSVFKRDQLKHVRGSFSVVMFHSQNVRGKNEPLTRRNRSVLKTEYGINTVIPMLRLDYGIWSCTKPFHFFHFYLLY